MYDTHLSYIQLKRHIETLIDLGLAVDVKSRDNQHVFKLSEKGKIFVASIAKYGNSNKEKTR